MRDLHRVLRVRAVCLAVVVGVVVSAGTACSSAPARVVAGQARSPEQAAEGFLHAVGDGRATDALAYLRVQPVDRALLTDHVLSRAARPVTKVTARLRGGGTPGLSTVDVVYTVAGQQVTDTYKVERLGEYWYIDEHLPTVPSFTDRPDGVGVTVDAATVKTDGYAGGGGSPILPGRYRMALDSPLLGVENDELTVTSLHAPVVRAGEPHPRLTDDGRRAVAAAAQETLTTCVDTTSVTGACLQYSNADGWVDGTARWSVDPGGTDLTATAPDWGLCDGYRTSMIVCADDLVVMLRMCAKTTDGTRRTLLLTYTAYTADISDPDHIQVSFSR